MKVLFVYPDLSSTVTSYTGVINYGIGVLSAVLREAGHTTALYHITHDPDEEEFRDAVRRAGPPACRRTWPGRTPECQGQPVHFNPVDGYGLMGASAAASAPCAFWNESMEVTIPMKAAFRILTIFFALAALAVPALAQQPPALQLPRPSQKATLEQTIGLTDVKIIYSRPGVKGRVIWGELVPHEKVWRTGANEATSFTVSKDVKINGQPLPAGTYSLHTIPTPGDWTIIFNRKADQWGSYAYDEKDDALRIKATPQAHPHTEWMMFSVVDLSSEKGTVALDWEKVRVPFTIETDTVNQSLVACREAMTSLKTDDNRTAYRCADFCFQNNVALDEGWQWLEKSVAIKPWWLSLRLMANWSARDGKYAQAIDAAQKAIEVGKTEEAPPEEMSKLEKSIGEWKTKS